MKNCSKEITKKSKKKVQIKVWGGLSLISLIVFSLALTDAVFKKSFNMSIGSMTFLILCFSRLIFLSGRKKIILKPMSYCSSNSYWSHRALEDRANSSIAGRGYPNGKQVNFPYY